MISGPYFQTAILKQTVWAYLLFNKINNLDSQNNMEQHSFMWIKITEKINKYKKIKNSRWLSAQQLPLYKNTMLRSIQIPFDESHKK